MMPGPDDRRRSGLSLVLVLALLAAPAAADEGMWLLPHLGQLKLRSKGLQIDPREIYAPDGPCLARATLNLGGGTGAFVSDQGLVLTNHHVALRAVQQISTPEHDYVRDGYLARSRKEERRARGYLATVTLRCVDVTSRILEGLPNDATEAQRDKHVRERIDAVIAGANRKQGDKFVRFRVKEAFDGAAYFLYASTTYRDVRLVYAPPAAIGEFGGDPDNWMWPRHCGDFAYLRVYAAPDGKPARYAKTNVPLEPQRWLRLSTRGVKEGDFTFILGYPGRTYRRFTSLSVRHHRDVVLPGRVKQLQSMLDRLKASSRKDKKAALRNLLPLKMIANGLKNFKGKVEWMKRKRLVAAIQADEEDLAAFVRRRPGLKRRFGNVFAALAKADAQRHHADRLGACLHRLERLKLVRVATVLQELGAEKAKPDAQRKRRYRQDRLERLKARTLRGLEDADFEADGQAFEDAVASFAAVPDAVLPAVLRRAVRGRTGKARKAALAALARRIWKRTRLDNVKVAARDFDLDAKKLAQLKDPLVRLAADLAEVRSGLRSARGSSRRFKRYRRLLHEVRRIRHPGPVYPDADSTLRFTFGTVRGYRARDAVRYDYITSLHGVVEKETGRDPFASPPRLLALARARGFGPYLDGHIKDVPVDFVHDTDITGGNSGSPVLNARGEMVGIAFDGNWEAITSDYRYDPELTRTISVDIRYVLFITDRFAGARRLLEEMGVKSL